MKFRTIEHTADIGIEVEGDSLEDLFTGAAAAMFSLMVDPGRVRVIEEREVALASGDLEELMFMWLNELLLMVDTEGLLFSRFEIRRIDERGLEAVVGGEKIDPERHRVGEEIKAATYHELRVERTGAGWKAHIVFDV